MSALAGCTAEGARHAQVQRAASNATSWPPPNGPCHPAPAATAHLSASRESPHSTRPSAAAIASGGSAFAERSHAMAKLESEPGRSGASSAPPANRSIGASSGSSRSSTEAGTPPTATCCEKKLAATCLAGSGAPAAHILPSSSHSTAMHEEEASASACKYDATDAVSAAAPACGPPHAERRQCSSAANVRTASAKRMGAGGMSRQ